MDVAAYLRRISYTGPTAPAPETLRDLHRRHLEAVPFENLDIWFSRHIEIDEPSSIRKIVDGRRGGFCYELNGAFAALLQALGFRVTLLSARVGRQDGTESPEFDHLALRVDLDEPWLADVGFGDLFVTPLRLKPGLQQGQDAGIFRLMERDDSLVLQRMREGSWRTEYAFTLTPHRIGDFAARCQFHQTSPDSHFTQHRICSRVTPEGRITLCDWKLIETRHGEKQERVLVSEEEWRAALRKQFEICLEI